MINNNLQSKRINLFSLITYIGVCKFVLWMFNKQQELLYKAFNFTQINVVLNTIRLYLLWIFQVKNEVTVCTAEARALCCERNRERNSSLRCKALQSSHIIGSVSVIYTCLHSLKWRISWELIRSLNGDFKRFRPPPPNRR